MRVANGNARQARRPSSKLHSASSILPYTAVKDQAPSIGGHLDRAIFVDVRVPAREGLHGPQPWRRLEPKPEVFPLLVALEGELHPAAAIAFSSSISAARLSRSLQI